LYTAAFEDYQNAIFFAPSDPVPRFNRAVLYSELKDYGSAVDDFNVVLKLLINDTETSVKRERALRKLQHPRQ
jgi:tetratricopeptide (TPR) repeat protein